MYKQFFFLIKMHQKTNIGNYYTITYLIIKKNNNSQNVSTQKDDLKVDFAIKLSKYMS